MKANPHLDSGMKLPKLLPRFVTSRDWTAAEAIKLLDDVAYYATAPIEASSGPKIRHRLNPNGNRQLNHAIHIAALGQISHETAGRAYYLAKQADGKSRKEAMRCLKRRISDAVYRQLRADLDHQRKRGPGGACATSPLIQTGFALALLCERSVPPW